MYKKSNSNVLLNTQRLGSFLSEFSKYSMEERLLCIQRIKGKYRDEFRELVLSYTATLTEMYDSYKEMVGLDVLEKCMHSNECLEIMKSEAYKIALETTCEAQDRLVETLTPEQKELFMKYEETSSYRCNIEEKHIFVMGMQYAAAVKELTSNPKLVINEYFKRREVKKTDGMDERHSL